MHYSGHGAFRGPSQPKAASQVLPSVRLEPDTAELPYSWLSWEDALSILALPGGVQLILVPDC